MAEKMYITIDNDGNLTGVADYPFYSDCIELPKEDYRGKKYDKKTKKLVIDDKVVI